MGVAALYACEIRAEDRRRRVREYVPVGAAPATAGGDRRAAGETAAAVHGLAAHEGNFQFISLLRELRFVKEEVLIW